MLILNGKMKEHKGKRVKKEKLKQRSNSHFKLKFKLECEPLLAYSPIRPSAKIFRFFQEKMKIKAKHIKSLLQELDNFANPVIELEQYSTPVDIAVSILQYIDDEVGFDGSTVVDLGCGTGVFLTGAAFLGSPLSIGIDCDPNALEIAKMNSEKSRLHFHHQTVTNFILADVRKTLPSVNDKFDIVLTNPPFGTKKNQGTDIEFVRAGLNILRKGGKLFSLHKSTTRNFLIKKAANWADVKAECVAELRWNLDSTYKFHKKGSVDIAVDLFKFEKF